MNKPSDRCIRSILASLVLMSLTIACYKSPNRFDVRGNGQGGVEVKRLPREPGDEGSTTSASSTTTAPSTAPLSREAELEARVRQLEAENQRLRQQPTTVPAP